MAILSVPIKFKSFKGNQLVREETLSESVIKIGKLASSHLRLDDETVSRMHAVMEVVGPGQIQLIDLGSTRGTLVNGERINKAILNPGDQIHSEIRLCSLRFAHEVCVVEATPPVAVLAFSSFANGISAGKDHGTGQKHDHRPPQPESAGNPSRQCYTIGHVHADAELLDGSKAIEVQTLYRGVGISTRHLTDATGKSTIWQAKAFMGAGWCWF